MALVPHRTRKKKGKDSHTGLLVASGLDDIDNEPNPFTVPQDEDVFLLRQKELEEKQMARERQKNLRIWEKTTQSTHMSNRLSNTIRLIRQPLTTKRKKAAKPSKSMAAGRARSTRSKENRSEFIAKKRAMFLIQMSLDTKRAEIKKLEERAIMKEKALSRAEDMLEEDAMRFDAFLKENDTKAHEALNKADMETQKKQMKMAEKKELQSAIQKVDADIRKLKNQLKDAEDYKNFLDSLTPPEHKISLAKQKARREERAERRRQRRAQFETDKALLAQEEADQEAFDELEAKFRAEERKDEEEELQDEDIDSMYFQEPQQLLDIFSHLEERILFLFQTKGETEASLEELEQKFEETRKQMEEKTELLKDNIDELQQKIVSEKEKKQVLDLRTEANTSEKDQQRLLEQLEAKVEEVYSTCMPDPTPDNEPLEMLKEIEIRLEELLVSLAGMDDKVREKAEKEKEEERRIQFRQKKQEEAKRQTEERVRRSNLRAQQEAKRKPGKIRMFRSPPVRRNKTARREKAQKKRNEAVEDIKKYFT